MFCLYSIFNVEIKGNSQEIVLICNEKTSLEYKDFWNTYYKWMWNVKNVCNIYYTNNYLPKNVSEPNNFQDELPTINKSNY